MTVERPSSPLGVALLPVIALVALLAVFIGRFETSGHIPLVLATAFAATIATFRLRMKWSAVSDGMVAGIRSGLPAMLVLMVVGMLVGTWIAAGVVPVMIQYGLMLLSPAWFLVAACVICSVVALATGSSWSTAATVGLALVGVGAALDINPGMTAGAIISGSYFGDKMSPLSDTTNLAPAAAGSELFEHIRHMLYTTLPAMGISLILFGVLGQVSGSGAVADNAAVAEIQTGIETGFNLSPILLLPPGVVLLLVVRRVPALPALLAGTLVAAGLGVLFQGASIAEMTTAAYSGFESDSGIESVDRLLSRGGMNSMMETIGLIICALAFAGVMESSGMLHSLAGAVLSRARSPGALVGATALSALGLNVLASDQYIAIIVPGRMYRTAYLELRLHPKNLSRALEDSGTMTSALVPWNTCGAYMASVLGVPTLVYLPFAFMNLLTPVLTVLYGFTRITIETISEDEARTRLAAGA